jgi:hypothetical protein
MGNKREHTQRFNGIIKHRKTAKFHAGNGTLFKWDALLGRLPTNRAALCWLASYYNYKRIHGREP